MRSASVQDCWDKVYKRDYKNGISRINLNGLNNFNEINFSEGPIAFCGLNGAGKSTIISAIKDLIGIHLTTHDIRRIGEQVIEGTALLDNHTIDCKNEESRRLFDQGMDSSNAKYIDCSLSMCTQDLIILQTNLEEFLEQYEECKATSSELKDINYLIGKTYCSCSIYEIEDINDSDESFPFFRVEVDGAIYDSRSMGSGEHFLLYLFWCIKRMEKNAILIIEEPETYISILSQLHFADYIGKIMSEKGIKIILTTHSPYILKNIKNENIRIISRMGNSASILIPDGECTVERALGISQNYLGTLFVEDRVAADLLTVILEDRAPWILKQYAIDIVDGEANITERLKFVKDSRIYYNFVGIYDGDMRNRLKNRDKLNWGYCFLPGTTSPEEIIQEYIRQPENLEKFCTKIGKQTERVIAILATLEGFDHHDWFLDLRQNLNIDGYVLIKIFYDLFMRENSDIDTFICDLNKVLENG